MRALYLLVSCAVFVLSACSTGPDASLSPAMREQAAKINVDLGNDYLNQNYYDLAKAKFLKAQELDSNLPQVYAGLGKYYAKVGENDLAEQAFQCAIGLSSHAADVLLAYANYLCQVNHYPEAFSYYNNAIAEPANVMMTETYTDAGNCAMQAHNMSLAQHYYQKALIQSGNNPTANLQLALIAYQQQNYVLAEQYLNQFNKESDPSPASLKLSIAIAEAMGNNDKAASLRLLLQAKFPNSVSS